MPYEVCIYYKVLFIAIYSYVEMTLWSYIYYRVTFEDIWGYDLLECFI